MFKALIFGGTTEGRELAEFCAESGIFADISVTSELGARLINKNDRVKILVGALDFEQMKSLILSENYSVVVDATHPFAENATKNIRAACEALGIDYYRVIRESRSEDFGISVNNTEELITLLNRSTKRILSTLGSKEAEIFKRVSDYRNRVWLRVLPDEKIIASCEGLGFGRSHIISGRGPFSREENERHIRLCGAEILVTKDSGKTGGYPEKIAAARQCAIEVITLTRPAESGLSISEIQKILRKRDERL